MALILRQPGLRSLAGALAAALILSLAPVLASASDDPRPLAIPDTQLEPAVWTELDGWAADDHAAAYKTFLDSCKPITVRTRKRRDQRPVFHALVPVCHRAMEAGPLEGDKAREFFESNFRPIRISRLGEPAGFLTGYYEPIVDGSRFPQPEFPVPIYRKPSDLMPAARVAQGAAFPNKGAVVRRNSRGEIEAYYTRGEIEDGVLDGKQLEIAWLKSPVDAFFIQIQGSGQVRLEDGVMLRVNYAAHNGWPYLPVGRVLIERGLVKRDEMSMDRIRQWMAANPDAGKDVRRLNRSFVFFRITGLSGEGEAVGAQGVPLTAWRSIAVDRHIHVYGTPFFIEAGLPIESEAASNKFGRLMISQDTGSAIIGPARADIYFGPGDEAGRIAGRLKHPGRFTMLVPNEIDPALAARDMPLPLPRPKDSGLTRVAQAETEADAASAPAPAAAATARSQDAVPLPRRRPVQ